jgi:predicted nucleotidyltransferase
LESNPVNGNFHLKAIKNAIAERIGDDRLKGVYLFGSEARSTAIGNSDIDILVLLRGPVHLGADLQEVILATYPLQLELDRFLHFIIADVKDYNSDEFSLYRAIKAEGIPA